MNKKILIVEDHDGLRLLMGSFLSKSFDVVSTKNGLEAMGWLSKGDIPDAIITDLRMPEINGSQLLSNLKCSGMFKDIPVIVISASEGEEDERRFRALGVRDFIKKPFNPVTLKDRLNQIIPISDLRLQDKSVA